MEPGTAERNCPPHRRQHPLGGRGAGESLRSGPALSGGPCAEQHADWQGPAALDRLAAFLGRTPWGHGTRPRVAPFERLPS